MERVEPVFVELARQSLRVKPAHPVCQKIAEIFMTKSPCNSLIALDMAVMKHERCNAQEWKLTS